MARPIPRAPPVINATVPAMLVTSLPPTIAAMLGTASYHLGFQADNRPFGVGGMAGNPMEEIDVACGVCYTGAASTLTAGWSPERAPCLSWALSGVAVWAVIAPGT